MKSLTRALIGLVLVLFFASPAYADTCSRFALKCGATNEGVSLVGHQALEKLGTEQARAMAARTAYYRYKTVNSCLVTGSKGGTGDCLTNQVTTFCPGEDGPLVDILRQLIRPDGTEGAWEMTGLTCLPNEVPGANKQPTTAMIVNAFHQTAWARANLGFQPHGNRTLVNLPSF